MTEGNFTRKLLRALRAHPMLSDAVIYKHSDYYTAGVPDFSVTLYGLTTWFEIKVAPNKPTALQALYLKKLQPRAYLITLERDGTIYINDRIGVLAATIGEIVYLCKLKNEEVS